jgi:type VI secretion system secreted protein Hcp
MTRSYTLLAALLLAGLAARPAFSQQSDSAYMTVKDKAGAAIAGGVLHAPQAGTMEVIKLSHSVSSPVDPKTGASSGKRKYDPLVVTKPVDKASPRLFQALLNSESLKEVTIQFFRPSRTGVEENHYTIKLTDVHIVRVATRLPNTKDPATAGYPKNEEISFTFNTIEWTWNNPQTTASDGWSQ